MQFFEMFLQLLNERESHYLWLLAPFLVALLWQGMFTGKRKRRRRGFGHGRNIRQASRELAKLRECSSPGLQYARLRGTDPFVFEEMVLTALQRAGAKIRRNRRYTGDGGIDGKVWIQGELVLVQAKRYRNHINPQHVQEFAQICRRFGARGLFVHTGRTGAQSRVEARANIDILSGEGLLRLLVQHQTSELPTQVSPK